MSETTWNVQQDTPSWSPEYCVSREGSDFVAYTYTQHDAERIARLLTEDDERQARRGHRDRSRQALDLVARDQPWSRQLRDWYGNANLDDDEAPLPSVETLDRLEAAYLAAKEQER